jgi:hypothetical protein
MAFEPAAWFDRNRAEDGGGDPSRGQYPYVDAITFASRKNLIQFRQHFAGVTLYAGNALP